MNVEQTLKELVSIDSVSSRSNAEIISYLAVRCEASGFTIRRLPYTDDTGVEKINMVAVAGTELSGAPEIQLAFVGHTDTVPYDSAGTEALELTEKDGKLYGRGACDTKAFIAAALTAIQSINLKQLKQPLALIFTADEEVGCLGAKRLAEARPFSARYAIVGEPTSLQPRRAGKGYGLAEINVRGREAHSAYPALGSSAIFHAAHLITCIEAIVEELKEDRRAGFEPSYTTLNVGLINGGTAKNIIAGDCRFTLEWRPVPGQDTYKVLNLLEQAIAVLQKQYGDFVCEIKGSRVDESFETPAGSPLVKFLEQASNKASSTVAFGTEAPSMIALGADAVVFGPGDIRVAHRAGEFVPIDQLNECVSILSRAIKHFCM